MQSKHDQSIALAFLLPLLLFLNGEWLILIADGTFTHMNVGILYHLNRKE